MLTCLYFHKKTVEVCKQKNLRNMPRWPFCIVSLSGGIGSNASQRSQQACQGNDEMHLNGEATSDECNSRRNDLAERKF